MRYSKLNQTIDMVDIVLEHHSEELKPECVGQISEYRQRLTRAKEEFDMYPSSWGSMGRAQKSECERLIDKVNSLVNEVSKYLEDAMHR